MQKLLKLVIRNDWTDVDLFGDLARAPVAYTLLQRHFLLFYSWKMRKREKQNCSERPAHNLPSRRYLPLYFLFFFFNLLFYLSLTRARILWIHRLLGRRVHKRVTFSFWYEILYNFPLRRAKTRKKVICGFSNSTILILSKAQKCTRLCRGVINERALESCSSVPV